MSDPTVSVVIPCYNAAPFVRDAVATASSQTHRPIEVICVDDGSTDGTLDVLRSLEREHQGWIRVFSQPNGGPSAARNRGLSAARGDWIQFLDSDDLLQPTKLAHQIALLLTGGRTAGLVVASYQRVRVDSGESSVQALDDDPWSGLLTARLGITSANLWRRRDVVEIGGWNEQMRTSEDPELVFRLLRSGVGVLHDHVPLTTLRRRPDSQWNADIARSERGWFRLRTEVLSYLEAQGELTDHRRRAVSGLAFAHLRRVYATDPSLALELHADIESIGLDSGVLDRLPRLAYAIGGVVLSLRVDRALRGLRAVKGRALRAVRRLNAPR